MFLDKTAYIGSIAKCLEHISMWSEEESGKIPVEDMDRIKREQHTGMVCRSR
jgi:hypothetical protein